MKALIKSACLLFILFILFCSLVFSLASTIAQADKHGNIHLKRMSGIEIPFIENMEQIKEKSVRFYAYTFAGSVLVTDKGEIVHNIIKSSCSSQNSEIGLMVSIRESLVWPDQLDIKGIQKTETKVNYFTGDKAAWKTGINTFQEVGLGEIYQGIELRLKARRNTVEKIFTVYPQGSVTDIKIKIDGAKGLYINKAGELEMDTEIGSVTFSRPIAYQEIEGKRIEVPVNYVLLTSNDSLSPSNLVHNSEGLSFENRLGDDNINNQTAFVYAFSVGEYDNSKPLIIDPALGYSTYFKMGDQDSVNDMAVDQDGAVYLTGRTWLVNFIITKESLQTIHAGERDVFITKIKPDGTGLVYSTFLGGSGTDEGYGIAVDSAGNAYVTGYTNSTNFTTLKAIQPVRSGSYDAFITKIDPNGSALVYSTFLGGSLGDYANDLALDSSGNVYVTGYTYSTNFPTKNPIQPAKAGIYYDVFVTKIDSAGSSLVYSTYLGGIGMDHPLDIAVDIYSQAYITGWTDSADFPVHNAFQPALGSSNYNDAFVAKINALGTGLTYSTYLGGIRKDEAAAIAVDSQGNAYVTGFSKSENFPLQNPIKANHTNINLSDAFVTKFNPAGSGIIYSTYLGGSNNTGATGIGVDISGHAYVLGKTDCSDFPLVNPVQASFGGSADAYLVKINPAGSALLYSTYLGGSNAEIPLCLAVDDSGGAYLAGTTSSNDFPTTPGVLQNLLDPAYDIFVACIVEDVSAPTAALNMPAEVDIGENFILDGSSSFDLPPGKIVKYFWTMLEGAAGSNFSPGVPIETETPTIQVTVNPDNPLPFGIFKYQLVVVDDSGNLSSPAIGEVVIEDLQYKQILLLRSESQKPPQIEFEKGIPVFISMRVPVPSDIPDDPVIQALNFLERYRYLYRLKEPKTGFYLKRIKTNQFDEVGGGTPDPAERHIFFGQHKEGIPVHLGSLALHIIGNKITSTGGKYLARIPDLPPPVLHDSEAEAKALSDVNGNEVKVAGVSKLSYFNRSLLADDIGKSDPTENQTHLAWRVMLRGGRLLDDSGTTWEYFIDAHDGAVLHSLELSIEHNNPPKDFEIYTASNTGSRWCWNVPDDGGLEKWFTHSGPTDYYPGGDADGDNAFSFAHTVYDYFHETFGRHSYDADGEQVEDIIHARENWRQAQYDPFCDHFVFGDYLPVLDIMAHEFTHGITSSEADLYYENHSGAVNESFSDVFAELVEYWATGSADWLIGEDVGYRGEDATAGGFDDNGVGDDVREKGSQCGNGIDDDADGFVDEGCPETDSHCGNTVDDDGDGFIDEGCPETDDECGNLIDNDGDGHIDEGCPGSCQDGIDNGGDGDLDSADVNCIGRDLADPTRKGDPDHNNDYVNTEDDHGGVHTNSCIPSKAAHLIVNGGVHYGINVQGIGHEKAQWLYYKVLADRLNDNSGFNALRQETLEQAQQFVDEGFRVLIDGLYHNFTQDDVCSVRNAFAAVGLTDADSDCDGIFDIEDPDVDGDYVDDPNDNCLGLFNPDQDDTDGDGLGDRCDPDIDGDGMDNEVDPCRYIANANDADCDGVLDPNDNCPATWNPDQLNSDTDVLGDECDTDIDGDLVLNVNDNCPSDYNAFQTNSDADAFGNACDNCDYDDNDDQRDMDRDGIGDVCDSDRDGDGEENGEELCPDIPNLWKDLNANGMDLACDADEQFMLSGNFGDLFEANLAFLTPTEAIKIPIFPCLQDGCADWIASNYKTEVSLRLPFDMQARIVDDRGFVISKGKAGMTKAMSFYPSADYFYRFPENAHSKPFRVFKESSEQTVPMEIYQGRSYFLEILPNDQIQVGQLYPFTIRVQSKHVDTSDLDGDGFPWPTDCNDSNPDVNPMLDISGESLEWIVAGMHILTCFAPSCESYTTYSLLRDFKELGHSIDIQYKKEYKSHYQSTYWFFNKICGGDIQINQDPSDEEIFIINKQK
ncbi:SBBP repeat-containing protein [bacterium]|nr:SBBP repeat-containing protein [bacterium]